MSDDKRKYYYTDAPSPLHEARDAYRARREEAIKQVFALRDEIGATEVYNNSWGCITGFGFAEPPDHNWKEGQRGYLPKKTNAARKELAKRIEKLRIPTQETMLPRGLDIMQTDGRYMNRSAIGWVGDRVFVTIPYGGTGDEFPSEIPAYLTECKRWEFEKYLDEYKAREEPTR